MVTRTRRHQVAALLASASLVVLAAAPALAFTGRPLSSDTVRANLLAAEHVGADAAEQDDLDALEAVVEEAAGLPSDDERAATSPDESDSPDETDSPDSSHDGGSHDGDDDADAPSAAPIGG